MANRLPKNIQDALDRLEPALARAFLVAIDQITSAAQLNRVIAEIEAGRIEQAVEALRIEQGFFSPLNDALRAAYIDGGGLALSGLKLKDPYHGDSFVLGFDGRHARAEKWVRDRSSELITEIAGDQRSMARDTIRAGLEAGRNPRAVALDIVGRVDGATGKRQGGFIGLTSQQAKWAGNAERELRDLDASYFTRQRRDKRFDATVRKAIKDGKPLAEADIRRIVTRYRDRLKKLRADAIARTEGLNAMRAGQWEGFEQLVESGQVRRDQIAVTWSSTMDGRTRDTHRRMNGQAIPFGQFFIPAPGVFMRYPGDLEHSTDAEALAGETIQCRCIASYRVKSDMMRKPRAVEEPGGDGENTPPTLISRSADEKRFLSELDLTGDAAGAFMATRPVRFVDSNKGFYVPGDHTINQRTTTRDLDGEMEHAGRKWIGTFAHEYGHAIDFDGLGLDDFPRSGLMVPAMAVDRADLIAERAKGAVSESMRATAAEMTTADAADRFSDLWQAGNLTEALLTLRGGFRDAFQAKDYKPWRDLYLDHYSIGGILDFIGAVSDLEKGAGHSKAYYQQFRQYDDQGGVFTMGHSTEAFANAFMAHALPRRAFLSELIEQAAPRTIARFRDILKERAKDAPILGRP